ASAAATIRASRRCPLEGPPISSSAGADALDTSCPRSRRDHLPRRRTSVTTRPMSSAPHRNLIPYASAICGSYPPGGSGSGGGGSCTGAGGGGGSACGSGGGPCGPESGACGSGAAGLDGGDAGGDAGPGGGDAGLGSSCVLNASVSSCVSCDPEDQPAPDEDPGEDPGEGAGGGGAGGGGGAASWVVASGDCHPAAGRPAPCACASDGPADGPGGGPGGGAAGGPGGGGTGMPDGSDDRG